MSRRAAYFAVLGAGFGAALLGLALVSTGCQSTQATSAELQAQGKKLIKGDKGLVVDKENTDIKVLDTKLLTDDNGSAVVVTVKNTSDQGFVNVPILIDVSDKQGKSVFTNDLPGLQPSLTSIPVIEPGQTFDWVNDQILATGKPDSVKVKVGVSDETLPADPPEIEVSDPKLTVDKFTGTEAEGTAENKSQIDQTDVTLFAVARKGDEVVAAGRGGLRRLIAGDDKPPSYHIFFIGDPEGADITVTAPATQMR